MEALASQPNSLQTKLISSANEMLDALDNINQRESNMSRLAKPVVDARNGTQLTDESGQPKQFVPNSCRAKCPIKSSKSTTDDPRMKELLEGAQKDHEAWQMKMAGHAKLCSVLEVKIRKDKLKKLLFELGRNIAVAKHIELDLNGKIPESEMTEDDFANIVTIHKIRHLPESCANYFGFNADEGMDTEAASDDDSDLQSGSDKMAEDYRTVMGFDLARAGRRAKAPDAAVKQMMVNETGTLLMDTTFNLWSEIAKKAKKKEIEAKIAKAFKPAAITKATTAVAEVLDTIDVANPHKEMDDYFDKKMKEGIAKLRRDLKKEQRLNCSGDAADQASAHTDNGRSTKRVRSDNSNASSSTSKKKKKKKGKTDDTSPKTPPPKKAKKAKKTKTGSRGGSQGGGKPNSAARR